MDMAIANLFKHKVHFKLIGHGSYNYDHLIDCKRYEYFSNEIENGKSIGFDTTSEGCLKYFKPFIFRIISTMVYEEKGRSIDFVTVRVDVLYGGGEGHALIDCYLDDPMLDISLFSLNSEMNIYPFPEHLLNEPFDIGVDATCYFVPDKFMFRERSLWWADNRIKRREKTFRQERCVICLKSPPNILYLDCKHIAVCSFCDNMKRTSALRKNCDICRAEISRRIII